MSSAALQPGPMQSSAIGGAHLPGSVAATRPYTAGSQPRDPYHQASSNTASPTSARRPPRRPSANGSSNSPYSSPTIAPQATSRTSHASNPTSPLGSPNGMAAMAPGDHQRGIPPVVTGRTSSTRAQGAAAAAASAAERNASSRRWQADDRASSSPRTQEPHREVNGHHAYGTGDERLPSEAAAAAAAAGAASRSRRRNDVDKALPSRPVETKESRQGQVASGVPVRMASTASSSPSGPSRQNSEVLSRMVVSKPEVDLDRERERMAEAIPSTSTASKMGLPSTIPNGGAEESIRGPKSRHDHSNEKKGKSSQRFGEYFLGSTLGEGEFGKVKMGWKQEGGVQVAIKLIRRDSVGSNPTRLAKVYREIAILREISHPNIVRLHEMVETEKQIGIILEYASGGELFDYILNHRYLKDQAARRLFAQLVSGVGYLHKKGIVHRDLKLENLLLDRNRNIIITDFGFANTFDPHDELPEDIVAHLSNRAYVKRMELDKIGATGFRRGDLMQTSCGSPCYAAPELVVSDSLYTGKKVDVWSCGVILYAMLAGYLPFDDDPANPEGDNINLLYKYIVSTPLTFPEYVTPHARDLLRRILVPDPRQRADLFEVARHSWLSEFHHVVGFITSSTSTTGDIANATIPSEDPQDTPVLARSASVREPSKSAKANAVVGDLARKHGNVDNEAEQQVKTSKDNKRRTVQVEYVAPRSQTQRGEAPQSSSKTRARTGGQGPVEVHQSPLMDTATASSPPAAPPKDPEYSSRRPHSSQRQSSMAPPARTKPPRSVSETAYLTTGQRQARPHTQGSAHSSRSVRSGSVGFGGRAGSSYSQPAAPAVADTNAHGRMSQPILDRTHGTSGSLPLDDQENEYMQGSGSIPAKFAKVSGFHDSPIPQQTSESKGHRRSNTLGSLLGRANSVFGRSSISSKVSDKTTTTERPERQSRKYPPISMSSAAHTGNADDSRRSTDSRRSISFGFGRKRSGSITGASQKTNGDRSTRRFSFLPAAVTKAVGLERSEGDTGRESRDGTQDPPNTANSRKTTAHHSYVAPGTADSSIMSPKYRTSRHGGTPTSPPSSHRRYSAQPMSPSGLPQNPRSPPLLPPLNFRPGESALNTDSETSLNLDNTRRAQFMGAERQGSASQQGRLGSSASNTTAGGRATVLSKNNRKFVDAYEPDSHYAGHGENAASAGAARKVMDFFRRRGKARAE